VPRRGFRLGAASELDRSVQGGSAGNPKAGRLLVAQGAAGEGRWRLHRHSEIEIKAGSFTGRYTSALHFECLERNRSVASFKFGPSRGGLVAESGVLAVVLLLF
jgi:hypothetical protein